MSTRTLFAAAITVATFLSAVPRALAEDNVVDVSSRGSYNVHEVGMFGNGSYLRSDTFGSHVRQRIQVDSDGTHATAVLFGSNSTMNARVDADGKRVLIMSGPNSDGHPVLMSKDGFLVHVVKTKR